MTILTIRDHGEAEDDLYPTPAYGSNEIILTTSDGVSVVAVPVTAVTLGFLTTAGQSTLLELDDIDGALHVTDSRAALVSTKYNKGSQWSGGLTAMALNVGSRAVASYRSRGTSLVGQVRYAWLLQVGGHRRSGMFGTESMRILLNAPVDDVLRQLYLDVTFPKHVDSLNLACEIARRAATYRLKCNDADRDAEAITLTELAKTPALVSEKGRYAMHKLPSSYPFSASTADLPAYVASKAANDSG